MNLLSQQSKLRTDIQDFSPQVKIELASFKSGKSKYNRQNLSPKTYKKVDNVWVKIKY